MSTPDGISLRRFAEQVGLSESYLLRLCRAGRVFGARKHPLTKKWTIYPPARLLLGWSARPATNSRKGGAA
jgi:hypothetical protein